ncbi:hypothetical protein [Halomicrococcus gelatinilyticus]|uniref:hypothetical protein n=1 Tax=Halomicrococcus gelatinilyticus TaxID=1702103 RepID=UPI002E13A4B1
MFRNFSFGVKVDCYLRIAGERRSMVPFDGSRHLQEIDASTDKRRICPELSVLDLPVPRLARVTLIS